MSLDGPGGGEPGVVSCCGSALAEPSVMCVSELRPRGGKESGGALFGMRDRPGFNQLRWGVAPAVRAPVSVSSSVVLGAVTAAADITTRGGRASGHVCDEAQEVGSAWASAAACPSRFLTSTGT